MLIRTQDRFNLTIFWEKEVVKVVNGDGSLNLYDPKLGRVVWEWVTVGE